MTVNVINNSISKFQDECRVVNMKHEYPGYTGTVKWIVVSDLTEAQLMLRLFPGMGGRHIQLA